MTYNLKLTDDQIGDIVAEHSRQEPLCIRVFGLTVGQVAALADYYMASTGRPACRVCEDVSTRTHGECSDEYARQIAARVTP